MGSFDLGPRGRGAVDGHDRGDLDLGHAEDLISLVGLPQHPAQGGQQQVAAMPDQPDGVDPQPPPVLLGVDDQDPSGPDDQVVDVGW
jgi:hypothetical protein